MMEQLARRDADQAPARDAPLSRTHIQSLIAQGKTIIIVDNEVLKVDAWLKYHPGGDKAILHMVGRDATDEVNGFHSAETRRFMRRFRIGRVSGRWKNFVPPIQGGALKQTEDDTVEKRENPVEPEDSETSSQSSAAEDAVIFDEPNAQSQERRPRRRRRTHGMETSSVSSLSSVGATTPPQSKPSHMDVFTHEAIALDQAKYPPIDPVTQEEIIRKYRLLYERIKAEKLFDCNYRAYFIEACRYSLLFLGFLVFLKSGWYALSGLFLGMLWHQLVFTVHDAGHMGITHGFQTDTIIGILIADFIGGLSLGWWKRNHNVHHIVTNSPEHDPDIEHMPFFAISHRFFDSLRSSYYDRTMQYDACAKFLVRYQNYLYYPILLFGRFNLYVLSWQYLILGQGPRKGPARLHRWLEISGQVFFWFWFGYLVVYKSIPTASSRWAFVLVSHMVTAPLHVQITLSHFAMSTADLGVHESFPQRMLRTTMDVDCPPWLDFIHGGLQFQAIHHLYPRLPRHNLRRTQKLVQEFCREVNIPYALYGFVDGNKEVIGKLVEVGRQAAILAECQKSITKDDVWLH